MPVKARASSVRPEPRSPATPSTSPSIRSTSAPPIPRADSDSASAEVRLTGVVRDPKPRPRQERLRTPPEHRLHQVDTEKLTREVLTHELAVAQHGHSVADLIDLIEEVRDENDGHPALFELADDPEQLGALIEIEAGGRFVQHQHPQVGRDGARNGHQLLDRR